MPITAGACACVSLVTNRGSEKRSAIGSWMSIIQNRIAKVLSVRVSFFVAISVTANPNAAVRASSAPG